MTMKSHAQILWVGHEQPVTPEDWNSDWTVHWVPTATATLSAGQLPDLVILDMPLADLDIASLLAALHDKSPATPLIVHDPFASVAAVVSYVRAGATDVSGPGSDLTGVVAKHLRRPLARVPRKLPPTGSAGASFSKTRAYQAVRTFEAAAGRA
jgi:DNA-binding NtrC family response regulator